MIVKKLRSSLGLVLLYAGSLMAAACSSETGGNTNSDIGQASEEHKALTRIPASDAGAKLGVTAWELGHGVSRAIGEDGSVRAEFIIHGEEGVVESVLPDVGTRSIADATNSTFSQLSSAYLDALRADLETQLDRSPGVAADQEVVNKATYLTYLCYKEWQVCDLQATYGTLNGWWRGAQCNNNAAECPNNPWRFALRYVPW